jgi:hypothetical protein
MNLMSNIMAALSARSVSTSTSDDVVVADVVPHKEVPPVKLAVPEPKKRKYLVQDWTEDGKSASEVIQVREEALEAVIPGLTHRKDVKITHVGKNAHGQLTRLVRDMVNNPFTWIRFAGNPGKEVTKNLLEMNYRWSKAHESWGCGSGCKPLKRVYGKNPSAEVDKLIA